MKAGIRSVFLLMFIVQSATVEMNGAIVIPQREKHLSKSARTASQGFLLTSQTSTEAFLSGDPVWVNLVVKNVGHRAQILVAADPEKIYKFTVKNEKGEDVPLTEYGKSIQTGSEDFWGKAYLTIKPGQEHEDKVLISRIYEMRSTGRYFISASRMVFRQDNKGVAEVTSNTVEVIMK